MKPNRVVPALVLMLIVSLCVCVSLAIALAVERHRPEPSSYRLPPVGDKSAWLAKDHGTGEMLYCLCGPAKDVAR